MSIQSQYSIIFMLLALSQVFCAVKARRSDKPIGRVVAKFNLAMVLPLASNTLIIGTHDEAAAIIGYYGYYIGMTLVMMALVSFTNEYCQGIGDPINKHNQRPTVMYILGILDIIQLLLNIPFKHAFDTEPIIISGKQYFKAIPELGLTMHRVISYIIFVCVLLIFMIGVHKTSRLYREKFTVIATIQMAAGVIQAYFIFKPSDIDKSVIVHGVIGVVIFYFSICYRPMRLLDTMLSNMASDMDASVFMFDAMSKCVWMNESGAELLGISSDRLSSVKDLLIAKFGPISNRGDNWSDDIYISGNRECFSIEKKSVKTYNKQLDGSFLIIKDITEKRNQVEKEIYDSMHDSLTDLYNKTYLYASIDKILKSDKTNNIDFYLVYINIKNFKIINDIFGSEYGDQVLISVADWLRTHITDENSIYGRLIADTFGILIPVNAFDEDLFRTDFSKFIVKYKNIEHQLFMHLGVYRIRDRSMDLSIMFDRAHLAVASIVDNYKTCIKYYDEDIRQSVLEEQRLTANLAEAIETRQIQPYLQPIVNSDGKVIGAEALARWIHPEQGFMAPIKFIPIFEKNGMIVEIDKYMWRCACEILYKWKGKHDDLFLSINISPKDFYFVDVVHEICSLVEDYDINPIKLRIEITETAMMSDPEERIRIFDELRSKGFIVEMDDFGSGYSSLNMLKDMPVDVLKIDMKFLSNSKNNKSNTIIKNVINLSKELEMTALTEGVETQQQYDQLVDMGCSLFQGYYFAKPMPVDEFEDFLNNRKR